MRQAHIALDESLGIKYALMPGDPGRIDRIVPFLDNVQTLEYNREFRSICGSYKGTRILVISTGIGGCSAGIAAEELNNIGIKAMIRIGSCGALQNRIGLGELIIVSAAVRDDGASKAYVPEIYPACADFELLRCIIDSAENLGVKYHEGIAHSHESFYHDENDEQSAFWSGKGVLGADMESAALFTIARLRGVKAASVLNNVVLYGQDTADSIGDYSSGASLTAKGEADEIRVALEAFALLDSKGK